MNAPLGFKILLILTVVLTVGGFLLAPRLIYATNAQGTAQGTQSTQGAQTQQGTASKYLSDLYIWFLGFVGLAALLALVIGGVMYMFAGANLTKTEESKKWISNAIWGIVLAAASYLILYTINPDLITDFNVTQVIQNALQ